MRDINREIVNGYLDLIEVVNSEIDKADYNQNMPLVDELCELVTTLKKDVSNLIKGI
jgi:hypothetical protein